MEAFNVHGAATVRKKKNVVVVVMGATGTGKSKLSIDLAARFPAEIINSDKIQVYRGLDVVTNKVTADERAAVPHHLLGVVDPDADFTASDFRLHASHAVEAILKQGRLPVIAGGSNSYLEALIDGGNGEFRCKYECCFLWVDVALPVLHAFVTRRVDQMVEAGLVEAVRGMFQPDGDYSKGIRRAIGVPEMDGYFRGEASADDATQAKLLEAAVEEIKANTRKLAWCQLQKIHRLARSGWDLHLLDATEAFRRRGAEADETWERLVVGPAVQIVTSFLCRSGDEASRELGMLEGRCGSSALDKQKGSTADVVCNSWGCPCSAICCNCSVNATLGSTAAAASMATTVPVAGATC